MRYYRVKGDKGAVRAVEHGGLFLPCDWSAEENLAPGPREEEPCGSTDDPRPLSPVQPGKIIAIGLNYRDHIAEADVEPPSSPLVFAKFPSSVTGSRDPIVIDQRLTERVDWEVELGVVIGQRMFSVSDAEALDGVFGYTVANDVSARDVQFADGQWVRGKSFDTFCPLGPCVVSRDEVPDPQDLTLRTRVNREVVQESSTALMVFSVAELVAFCSRSFTLEPGDLLLTGTPWGCGEFMDPRRSLHPGDLLETEIEGIGTLRNPVVATEAAERRGESAEGVSSHGFLTDTGASRS